MNDAEYIFKQTARERKVMGYGDKHKKRQGGKFVRLPSDHLTKKERNAMNGECKTYNISKRMTWEEFKAMPHELQQEHIDFLQNNFQCGPTSISSRVFGVRNKAMDDYCAKHGLRIKTFGTGSKPNKKYQAWLEQNKEDQREMPQEPVAVPIEEPKEEAPVNVSGVADIAALLSFLAGTGAKITIELTL